MTKEELKEHCEKQVKMCEEWARGNDREPSGKVYEEHKLILEILEENKDWQDYIDTVNQTNSRLIQIIERHKMQQSRKVGKWVKKSQYGNDYCSECNYEYGGYDKLKYCPNCGADMRGEN